MNALRGLLCLLLLCLLTVGLLAGCEGKVFKPRNTIWYYHKELPEADSAIDAARGAGRDKECPDLFSEAVTRRDNAYSVYWQCRTQEAIALAKEAKELADSPCPKPAAVAAPPPPEPEPEPTEVVIPEAKIVERMILNVNFDFDKAVIRPSDYPKMDEAVKFVQKYPDSAIVIDGHTDNVGTRDYNHELSHRRAEAAKKYILIHAGIPESRIKTRGFGSSQPIASNDSAVGRFSNRRVEILIVSE